MPNPDDGAVEPKLLVAPDGFPNKPCGGDDGVTGWVPKPVPRVVLPKTPEDELADEGLLKSPAGGEVDESVPLVLEVLNNVEPLDGDIPENICQVKTGDHPLRKHGVVYN